VGGPISSPTADSHRVLRNFLNRIIEHQPSFGPKDSAIYKQMIEFNTQRDIVYPAFVLTACSPIPGELGIQFHHQ
jgi:hypothetical protein